MSKYRFVLLPLSLALCLQLPAQTHVLLDTVDVVGPGMHLPSLLEYDSTDRSLLYTDLGDWIRSKTGAYVRAYNPGGLQTLALSGTSAAHTIWRWNGLSLNSPMNGLLDLSLLPANFFGEVQMQRQPDARAAGGSFSVGDGALTEEEFSADVGTRLGSFGEVGADGGISWKRGGYSTRSRLHFTQAENDFPFANDTKSGSPQERLVNGSNRRFHALHSSGWNIGSHDLNGTVWFADASRELPPPKTKDVGAETQEDRALRLMASWSFQRRRNELLFTGSWMREMNSYANEELSISDQHLAKTWRSVARWRSGKRAWDWALQFDQQSDRIESTAYSGNRLRHRLGVKAWGQWRGEIWYVRGGTDQVLDAGQYAPFSPFASFGASKTEAATGWEFNGGIHRHFRFPTANDLYWEPGGNPELRSEHGWKTTLDGSWMQHWRRNRFGLRAAGYFNRVSDWIQWVPDATGRWSPMNVREVRAYGGEAELWFERRGALVWSARAAYNLTRSENVSGINDRDQSVGKQLVYTPMHGLRVHARANWKGFYAQLSGSWTGKRYTSTDNSDWLPAFATIDLTLGKRMNFGDHSLTIAAVMKNALNEAYELVALRPMPGRHFQIRVWYKVIKARKSS